MTRNDLKRIVLLTHLTDPMLDGMLAIIDILKFEFDELIFRQGDTADRFYMLNTGKVLLEQIITDDITVNVGAIKPGYSFGWSAMIEGERYSTDAVSVEPCEIYSFTKEKIQRLIAEEPMMGMMIYKRLLVIIKKRYDNRTDQFRRAIMNHSDMWDLFRQTTPDNPEEK